MTAIVAVPVPDADPTVAHDALLVAVHGHPVGVVIATLTEPAVAPTLSVFGVTETPHAAAACATLMVLPPRLIEPVRDVPSGLAAIVNVAEPFPVPLPVPIVIHGVLVVACHAQPDVVVTVMVFVPDAVDGSANDPGATV